MGCKMPWWAGSENPPPDKDKIISDLRAKLTAAEQRAAKWECWNPDDETMRTLQEQAQDSSLAAKTAYIGALEQKLKLSEQRAAEAEKDAERWKFWRDNHGWSGYFDDGLTNSEDSNDIDAAVDAAIASNQTKGK